MRDKERGKRGEREWKREIESMCVCVGKEKKQPVDAHNSDMNPLKLIMFHYERIRTSLYKV